MQRNKYIVVRRKEPSAKPPARLGVFNTTRSPGQRSSPPWAGYPGKAAMPELEWETESMSDDEQQDRRRDPQVQSITRAMPASLVKPVAASTGEVEVARAAGSAWGVELVAPAASEKAGAGLTVAVLDTGIDSSHPAFPTKHALNSVTFDYRDFTQPHSGNGIYDAATIPVNSDAHGHGTHCAATIFGRDVEGVRIGIARGVRHALIGKVLDDQGYGDSAMIADALFWAQQNGANVISLSVAIDFAQAVAENIDQGMNKKVAAAQAMSAYRATVRMFDSLFEFISLRQAVAGGKGCIIVAAAGNGSARDAAEPVILDLDLPAAAQGIVSVGAIGRGLQGYQIAACSNTNPTLCAPGVDIVSAKAGGGLIAMTGTSMAVPHAAGACLLWWEELLKRNPLSKAEDVRARLLSQSRKQGFAGSVRLADIGAGWVVGP